MSKKESYYFNDAKQKKRQCLAVKNVIIIKWNNIKKE